MTRKEINSCIRTIDMLKHLAYNVNGVMDVIDKENCDKIIEALEKDVTETNVGKWIRHPLYRQKEFREWDVCTACGTGCRRREYGKNPDGTEYETIYGYRYCPNCNAKMEV